MIDLNPILSLIKGKGSENFKAVIDAMKLVNDEVRLQYEEIKKDFLELKEENKVLKAQIEAVIKLEENCLQRNVEANDLIRNLCEWIIFEEKRTEVKRNIAYLINGKK